MAKTKKRAKKVKKSVRGASKRTAKAVKAPRLPAVARSKAKRERPRKRKAGNPGFAGYEYQIEATIWIALDLILAKSTTSEIVIEPPSDEDVEASVTDPDKASLELGAPADRLDYMIQIKTKSGAPWSAKEFAGVLTGKNDEPGRGRARPLEILSAKQRRRYIFVTNEALASSLRTNQGSTLYGFPDANELPPYARDGYTPAQQADLGKRLVLCSGITDEVLAGRIGRLLSEHGHVPGKRHEACLRDLRDAVRMRMSGKTAGAWTRDELIKILATHGGSVAPTRAMIHYIAPRSYDQIREMLDRENAVVIAGPSGTGKTLTADIIEDELRQSKAAFEVVGAEHGPHYVRGYPPRSQDLSCMLPRRSASIPQTPPAVCSRRTISKMVSRQFRPWRSTDATTPLPSCARRFRTNGIMCAGLPCDT